MGGGGGGGSSLPAFFSKMYQMVDEPSRDAMVASMSAGTSFVIANQAEFRTNLLPKYFKHNNFSSSVRLLNTYIKTMKAFQFNISVSHHPKLVPIGSVCRAVKLAASQGDIHQICIQATANDGDVERG